MNHKSQRGFTLIEILVVLGIVIVLAAVIFPALGRAKISAYNTGHAVALKNVGVARQLYEDTNGGECFDTSLLVNSGMDPKLLASPIDPFPEGAANVYRKSPLGDEKGTRRVTNFKDSVITLNDVGGKLDGLKESSGGGWAIIQAEPPNSGDPKLADFKDAVLYANRIVRLRFDGSVVSRAVIWKQLSHGNYATNWGWLFTDDFKIFPL